MNKRNYARELDNIIDDLQAQGSIPRLLLHVCCAPCSSACLEFLRQYFDVTVFYYNPNITEEEEYRLRAAEEQRLIEAYNGLDARSINYTEGAYEPEVYLERIAGLEDEPEGGKRCTECFSMRLEESAKKAAEEGFDFFTTTLTISPLKDADRLNTIGEHYGRVFGVPFLPSDFKKKDGYKRSIELSREYGLYRQDYCGCVFSKGRPD